MLTITAIAGTNGSPGVMNTNVFLKINILMDDYYKPDLTNENISAIQNVCTKSVNEYVALLLSKDDYCSGKVVN